VERRVVQLQAVGIAISKREVMRLLIHRQDDFLGNRGGGSTLRGAGGLAPDVHDGERRHGEAVIAGRERSCE
jgi:hypothetical protein